MEHAREQRPSAADTRVLADQAAPLLQPRLQHTRLVRSTARWGGTLVDEDELTLGVNVLVLQRKELLRPDAAQERSQDDSPVARLDSLEEMPSLVRRHPATLLALACGPKA